MTVKDYLNVMLGNDAVREQILKNLSKLQRILSEDTCHVVQQISDFDLDVIEVSNGYASRISTREFFVFRKEDFDGKSSRAFVPYDCLPPPDPGCFAEGIDNSFPDLEERVKVLNKLYQCLVAYRMPEKVRKLVFLGPPFFAVSCRLTRSFLSRLGDNSQPVLYGMKPNWSLSTNCRQWPQEPSELCWNKDVFPTSRKFCWTAHFI